MIQNLNGKWLSVKVYRILIVVILVILHINFCPMLLYVKAIIKSSISSTRLSIMFLGVPDICWHCGIEGAANCCHIWWHCSVINSFEGKIGGERQRILGFMVTFNMKGFLLQDFVARQLVCYLLLQF